MNTIETLKITKASIKSLASLTNEHINSIIMSMAEALVSDTDVILESNALDIERATGTVSEVMLDRLRLDRSRIEAMADGMKQIAVLPSPVGAVFSEVSRPNGLVIKKIRVPIGLVAIIYESRPNVTSDAACLAVKSGNVCVLRCGKEAYNSSLAIVNALKKGIEKAGADKNIINLVTEQGRESANTLMTANGLVDLLIPRGGAGLISACVRNATVPCIQTGTGICHVYVDVSADIKKALAIVENAKTSRPSVCNAEEVLLVHKDIADEFLPKIKEILVDKRINNGQIPVELRLCEKSLKIIEGTRADKEDFDTEFLDYILAVKVVSSVEEAVCHISTHSTGHSEAIIAQDKTSSEYFIKNVDSAAVYVNASTRFTDGGEFGLGCEMGISTQKLHARGPMGLEELTTYKYVIEGNGQTR